MRILGIETSCDETSASVIEADKFSRISLLSNVVASSIDLHATTGGIIPETAARQQLIYIIPIIKKALSEAGLPFEKPNIDAIGITYGPGLIGSLLIGTETARTLSYIWKKPLVPVNHLFGHIYANWVGLDPKTEIFPAISLIVSGGHTDLLLMKSHKDVVWLGGTRDDAAGEAMDKIGRLLGLPYPGGPSIEKAAKNGDRNKYVFPRPLIGSKDFDFSFSGLKAAVYREVEKTKLSEQAINDICAGTQKAIVSVLTSKTIKAAQKYKAKSLLLGGGVAANQALRNELQSSIINHQSSIKLFAPPKSLCTDNGAMIATAAFFRPQKTTWEKLNVNPELYF